MPELQLPSYCTNVYTRRTRNLLKKPNFLAPRYVQNGLLGAIAILFGPARIVPGTQKSGPVLTAAVSLVTAGPSARVSIAPSTSVSTHVAAALGAFQNVIRPLSDSRAESTLQLLLSSTCASDHAASARVI